MKTSNPNRRVKPRTTPNPDTWYGRHAEAMTYIRRHLDGRKGRIVAWVVGFGGGLNEEGTGFSPTEHLEVAEALKKAGVDFRVHALDVSEQAVQSAKAQLKLGESVVPARHPSVLHPKKTAAIEKVTVRVPDSLRERIVLHGPQDAGNIFLVTPDERPDVITVFNVARSYQRRHQKQLARKLAQALKPEGVLLTDATDNQTVFVKTLEKILGGPADLGPTHDEGKEGRMVAFEKKARS